MYPTIIKTNFFSNPEEILNQLNSLPLYKPTEKDNWPGKRSNNLSIVNTQLHAFIVNEIFKLYFGNQYFNYYDINVESSEIKYHKLKENDWKNHTKMHTRIHKDNCDLAGIIYLNKNTNDINTGTSIYDGHKKPMVTISNCFNTIACYDGNVYHGATSLNEEDRNIIVIFLRNIEKLKA
jgi:hypothetical protein